MSNTDISKLFAVSTQKTQDGKTIKGINQDNFFMSAQSIFSDESFDAAHVFDELDTDGDKILTTEELASLTQYIDDSMLEEQEEAGVSTDSLEGILNSSMDFNKKLNYIKDLDLKENDIKNLSVMQVRDLLNIISGAYADKPNEIGGDTLFNAIMQNRPKDELKEIANGEKGGYWLSKYGLQAMNEFLATQTGGNNSGSNEENSLSFDLESNMEQEG